MQRGLPVITLTLVALVVVAAFLPWATISGRMTLYTVNDTSLDEFGFGSLARSLAQSLQDPMSTVTATGWSGNIGVLGISFPNWLVVAAALFVAGYALLGLAPNTQVPRALPLIATLYGLLHLFCLAVLVLGLQGSFHLGYFIALAAFAALLAGTRRRGPATPPVALTGAAEEPATAAKP